MGRELGFLSYAHGDEPSIHQPHWFRALQGRGLAILGENFKMREVRSTLKLKPSNTLISTYTHGDLELPNDSKS